MEKPDACGAMCGGVSGEGEMKKRKSKDAVVRLPQDEIDERVEYIMELEAQALLPGQMKRAFREKYGDVSKSQIAEYVGRARARVQESHKERVEELGKKAIARYEAIIRDPATDPNSRIRAQERIDKIWGVEAPSRSELSGVNGGAIQIEQLIAASELTPEDVKRALAQTVFNDED